MTTTLESKDLTKGFLPKQILLFSLPLVASNLLQVLFNMADIAVVGRFSGQLALGAVGCCATTVALYTGFCIGMGSGVNAISAIAIGSKENKQIFETMHTSFIICLLFGLLISLAALSFNGTLLTILHTKEELFSLAHTYLNIYCLGMPALALYNYGNAIYSANGQTKKPLLFLTVAGFVNIILNLIFVLGFKLGVKGVALASISSHYLSAILVITSLCLEKNQQPLVLNKIRLYPKVAGKVLYFGLIAGFQNAIFFIANLFIQSAVNSFDTLTVEGVAAASNSDSLVWDVMAAFYTAASSFIGQNYGARNKKRIMASYLITLAYSFFIALIMGGLLVLNANLFLGLFTTETSVIEAGKPRLIIMGLCYCLSAFMDNSIAASRGLGKTVIPTIFVIIGSCIFRIIWILTIFNHYHTMQSLYYLYFFSWIFTSCLEIPYFIFIYHNLTKDF